MPSYVLSLICSVLPKPLLKAALARVVKVLVVARAIAYLVFPSSESSCKPTSTEDRSIIARLLLRLTLLAQQQAWLEKNHRFCE